MELTRNRRDTIQWSAVLGVIVVAFAACGGNSPITTGPATGAVAPTQLAVATSTPAASPSTTAAPPTASARPLCAVGATECPLTPGTYTSAPFVHPFSFAISTKWRNTRAGTNGGGIETDKGGFSWASGITAVDVDTNETAIKTDAASLLAFVTGLAASGREVGLPSPVTIGGISGQQIDVSIAASSSSVGFIIPGPDQLRLDPGSTTRIYVLETPGDATLFFVTALKKDDFASVTAMTDPVLQSVVWQ
jgi:hypothetical protein